MQNKMMKRKFMGYEIRQHVKDEMISASDFLAIYNEHILPEENRKRKEKGLSQLRAKRIDHYWENKSTLEFVESLSDELKSKTRNSGISSKSAILLAKNYGLTKTKRGKEQGVFMNPYLFVDFAMWISPSFRAKVVIWVTDNLILQRIEAGIQYKPMTDAIKKHLEPSYKPKFENDNAYMHEAILINKVIFGEHKPDIRQEATKEQLKLLGDMEIRNTALIQAGVLEEQRINILMG